MANALYNLVSSTATTVNNLATRAAYYATGQLPHHQTANTQGIGLVNGMCATLGLMKSGVLQMATPLLPIATGLLETAIFRNSLPVNWTRADTVYLCTTGALVSIYLTPGVITATLVSSLFGKSLLGGVATWAAGAGLNILLIQGVNRLAHATFPEPLVPPGGRTVINGFEVGIAE
jgi:hypothetical protein